MTSSLTKRFGKASASGYNRQTVMDEKKRGLDDLLSDLGIGENEAVPEVVLKQEAIEEPAVADVSPTDPKGSLEHFMVGMLMRLDPSYSVNIKVDGDLLRTEIVGGDTARAIGKEGKTLQSLEFIANVAMAKQFGNQYRVILDVGGYRKRNEERVKKIALDAVLQVEVSGQPVELPPMRSGERRTIHVLLKQHETVETSSSGDGFDRHIVIYPKGTAPTGSSEESEAAE